MDKQQKRKKGLWKSKLGWERRSKTKVAHHLLSMVQVKNPANTFWETIAGINDSLNLLEEEMTGFFPILDGKVLYVDVS
jgi:hypothetical protein